MALVLGDYARAEQSTRPPHPRLEKYHPHLPHLKITEKKIKKSLYMWRLQLERGT